MNISTLLRNDRIDDSRKYLFIKIRLKYNSSEFSNRKNLIQGCYLILIILSCLYYTDGVDTTTLKNNKRDLIKSIWSALTPQEVRHIFGNSEQVPNLDVISIPDIFHQNIKRKTSVNENEKKVIEISGLGRRFNLTLFLNPNLITQDNFVHVFRHHDKKSSHILSDDIVKNQLDCFYHGTALHTQIDEEKQNNQMKPTKYLTGKKIEHDIKFGRVALDLCNGIKGFIVPNDGDSMHHYVIHPVPDRLYNIHAKESMRDPNRQHFLWRKQSHVAPTPEPSSLVGALSSSTSDLSSSSSCGHNHRHSHSHSHDSTTTTINPSNNEHVNPRSNKKITTFKKHEPLPSSSSSSSNSNHKKRNRFKRSYIDDTQFQYKPLSIAADSYWFRYRTTDSPSEQYSIINRGHGNDPQSTPNYRSDSVDYSDNTNANPHPIIYSHYATPTITDEANDNDWGKSILVYDSSESITPSYKQTSTPFFSVPFYTKLPESNENISRRSGFNYPTQQQQEHYNVPSSSYSTYFYNTTRSRVQQQHPEYYTRNEPSNYPWVPPTTSERRSRADDIIFGENWKSSLDSDIMSSAQSIYSQTRLHQDKEPAHLTIETAVFVDKDLYKHMELNFPDDTQAEVSRIVLAMINAVQLLYQDPSLGHKVDFVLKRLEILSNDPPGLLRPYDIDRFLTNFCKWQKIENPVSDADPLHWDHALILTGLDLYVVHQSGKISNQVVGLAPVAGMCTRSSSCTVNEGRHFESVYVVAHEIGHNLGMRHDGPQAENECDPSSHIMSPTLGSGKITWSACSKRYLDMFLETNQSKCLLDKAKSESRLDHDADGRLPGERFDADRQCVLKYGRGSYHASQQPLEDVCRDLHCRREHYTWTSHPALEGTFCGLDMWCRAGKCTIKTSNFVSSFEQNFQSNKLGGGETAAYSAPKALDGGWGKWSTFTDCSSACLYADGSNLGSIGSTGIRLAARRCDSPRPENGGRQCTGPDRRYKTCPTEKICPFGAPKTSVSQYANEVCTRAATVDTELTGRGFMTNTDDQERACSVWCETTQRTGSRSRGWSFPDGTSCQLATTSNIPNYCVAGKCQFFVCDPESHYALSDEQCKILNLRSNEVNAKKLFHNPPSNNENYYNNKKIGWTNWEIQSDCKLSCLAPAKGLELVKRQCDAVQENQCSGLSVSVRLCKPDKSTILSNGCSRLQTPFEYATRICSQYSAKVAGLSGIGMQLSPTKDDADRPCRVGCQDSSLLYRFYMVNGEEGWFPAGTDCSRGEPEKKTFCLGGKCIDFGTDDTPLYRMNARLIGKLESIFQRSKREIPERIYLELKDSSLDQASLSELIENFSAKNSRSLPDTDSYISETSVDFSRPILVPSDDSQYQMINFNNNNNSRINYETYEPKDEKNSIQSEMDNLASGSSHSINSIIWQNQPIEGSFYEWRKIVSDCSVSCGSGIEEVIVQCISGDTVVPDSLCQPRPRPGYSGYINCQKNPCSKDNVQGRSSSLWNWLQSLLNNTPD